ncbi:MAG: hypothetical protein ACD_43C00115G0005, partial [uncultured bacterium]
LSIYQALFGEVDYSYEVGDTHFIALSTAGSESRGEVSAEQLTWLETELQTTQTHTIVYLHHPLVVPSWGQATCCYVDTTNRDELADLLDRYAPDLVIAGHSQGYDYRQLTSADVSTIDNGFYQLVTGGAGGTIAQPDGDYHYTLMHVSPDGVTNEPIYETNFGLAIDYENNRGTKTAATAIIENNSDYAMPYVRLRFRLATTATNFTISDDLGTYYSDYDWHAYDDYTVVYVAIPISANSTSTIIIAPSTELHSGTTQTVTPSGNVSYETEPINTTTATDLTAQPTSANIVIANLTETGTGLTWDQTATASDEVINYTMANLEPIQVVDVFVDAVLHTRVVADANGQINFTVSSSDLSAQAIQVARLPVVANQVITVPSLIGDPQIRFFDKSGAVQGQWYAFRGNSAVQQPYALWQTNITGTATPEIIITGQSTTEQIVELSAQDGTILATAEIPSQPISADIDGNGYSNILYYHAKQRNVRSFFYDGDAQDFTLEHWLVPKPYRSDRLELLTAKDPNHDGRAELAFFDATHDRFIVMAVQTNRLVVTGRYSLPHDSTISTVDSGQLDTKNTQAWVIAYQNKHGVSRVDVLQPNNTGLNFQRTRSLRLAQATISQVLVAPVIAGKLDRLVFSTPANKVFAYRPNNQAGFSRLQKISTTLGSNGPIGLTWLTGSQTYPRELVIAETNQPGQLQIWQLAAATKRFQKIANWYGYGENFSGGTTVAEQ